MARPLRIEFSGVLYHTPSRGNASDNVYQDDSDRLVFLGLLNHAECELPTDAASRRSMGF